MKNPKNCSVESELQKGLFLNFDEEGLINIVINDGKVHMIMHIAQWVKLHNHLDEDTTEEKLLMEHFGATYE